MVQLNELRLGNYVLHSFAANQPGSIKMVCSIDFFHIGFSKNGNDGATIHSCSGISLSPEILKQCGFTTMDYESDTIQWGLDDEPDDPNAEAFHIDQDGFPPEVQPFMFSYNIGFGDHHFEIKHLHQLQNLFFELRGKELTVSLIQPTV